MISIDQVASQLRKASESGQPISPIRELIGVDNIEIAYAIQDENTRRRVDDGARIVGSKIGLTSIAVQKQLGVDQPDFGVLFDDMEVPNGLEMDFNLLMQPKVEAEIAFILGRDLGNVKPGVADIISAVEYVVPSIEIVGSRIKDWDIKITDTIADNASASHFVLGHQPKKLESVDLVNCEMQMVVNGEVASKGFGAACLGSPINAMVWLANTMARQNRPLTKGDVILSGALGPMAPVKPGDVVVAEIEGLGKVSVDFSNP